MYCTKKIASDLVWVGANDRRLAMFEGVYSVPAGVSYNSYLLTDEKTVLFDTVDKAVSRTFFENLEHELGGRPLDYVIVHHMEPDHSATLSELLLRHPETTVVCNDKTAVMIAQFFGKDAVKNMHLVKEGDVLSAGAHELTFYLAPMIHWPEVMMTYDKSAHTLFTADAFGVFGALNGAIFADEVDFDRDWLDDARRYLTNIVGKYGPHIQVLLGKAAGILDQIRYICPLHGPVWRDDLAYFIQKYDLWSRYEPETEGVLIIYASMYGNTEAAAQALAAKLCDKGMNRVAVYDVSSTHKSQLISETFKYSHVVLASVTYNLGIYPAIHDYLMDLKALNVQNRTFALIENGSWAVKSGDLMQEFLDGQLKRMTVLTERLSMASALSADKAGELEALADAILESMQQG